MSDLDEQASLDHLIALLHQRNQLDRQISQLIGRPSSSGHLGEYIASKVFDIELHLSATTKASDGIFKTGPLAGKSVNIKLYGKREAQLDIVGSPNVADHPHYYLVMTGPTGKGSSSRSSLLIFAIDTVYLFDSRELVAEQVRRNVKLGIASSMQNRQWEASTIYPNAISKHLVLDERQRWLLSRFASSTM